MKLFKYVVCECDITGRIVSGMMVAESRDEVKQKLDEDYMEVLQENNIDIDEFKIEGYQITVTKLEELE